MRWHHWCIAVIMAISMHAGVLAAIFYHDEEGSEAIGEQGIEFDLGMLGDMTTSEAVASAPAAKKEPVEPKVVEKKPVETVEQALEKMEPVVEPETEPEPEPIDVKQDALAIENVTQVKTPPVTAPKESMSAPKEPRPKKPEPEAASTVVEMESTAVEIESAASVKQTAGTANANNSGAAAAIKAKQAYYSKLAIVLAKNKRYPETSRKRNEEGVVVLAFTVNRDGSVEHYEIRKSSGRRRLDKAVLDMLERSKPLPVFADDMTENSLSIDIPISFSLND